MISGFTFVHNALHAGIPVREAIQAVRPYVDEVVVVDASSDDGTYDMLYDMPEVDDIIVAEWGTDAGATLARLHAMHIQCKGDIIVHFEADEVFDDSLIQYATSKITPYQKSFHVFRIQVEQNFQRIRWYPELVHRIFEKGTVSKVGHTTNAPVEYGIKPEAAFNYYLGYLWDITNCFRDNFLNRIDQQAKLWDNQHNYRMVPKHFNHPIEYTREEIGEMLQEPHWTWKTTPLNIPDILKPLVGKTKYK
jgi:hypothetical protein